MLLANLSVIQAQINPPACTKVKLQGPNLRAFLDTLVPGDVGCLRAGIHGARGTESFMTVSGTQSAPITLKGYPGDAIPTILGYFPIGGNNIVISGLLFDGPTGRVATTTTENPNGENAQISVYGDNVEVSHCEIRNNGYHAGIYLATAFNARLISNYIHDNGRFGNTSSAYQDHGIYFASGSGLIANNLIERNWSFGVHLYPSASNVIVQQNTIIRNVQSGVIIDNCAPVGCAPQPTNNLVVNNIIAFNQQHAFQSSIRLTGAAGNIIKNNLLWGNAAGDIPTDERLTRGLTFVNQNNIQADPRFVGTSNYHLQSGSPAIDAALNPYMQPDDFDFVPRPQGAASDIGAFEFTPTPPPTPTPGNGCTPTTTVSEGDLFPGGIPSFGVASGAGSVTVDHVNAGSGLQSFTVVSATNAVVNIPAFTPGTFNPVTATFTATNPSLPVDFTLRAASTFHGIFIRVRCGNQACTPTATVTEGDLSAGGIPSFGVSSGTNSVTADHVNAGTGLRSFTVVSATNATVNIPAFPAGTYNPVVATYTIINPSLPVDFTLRAASTFHAIFIRVRCGSSANTFSGRATSVNATIGGMNAILADTGPLPSTGGYIERSLASANVLGGALTTGLLNATTQAAGDQSRSQAQVANLNLTTGGNSITGDLVPASSQCTCTTGGPVCVGGIYIANLRVNGAQIAIVDQAVNQTVNLPGGGTLVYNEQIRTGAGNAASLTVNGVHVRIPAVSDVTISSAQSGIVCATTQ